jgi:hypothetical protein
LISPLQVATAGDFSSLFPRNASDFSTVHNCNWFYCSYAVLSLLVRVCLSFTPS